MPGNVDQTCAVTALHEGERIISGWWESPADRMWLQAHANTYREQLLGLARSLPRGGSAVREAQDAVLNSESGRVCCLIYAALKRGKKFARAEIDQRAMVLRPWKNCGEPVTAVVVEDAGKSRLTACLGINRLALNYLVRDILTVMWGIPDDEYNCTGRGAHRAVEAVMREIRGGLSSVGMADVKDCFPSFRQEGLSKKIRLPESVVRNVVLLGDEIDFFTPYGSPVSASVRDTLRRGLPQGTPTSSIIASLLLAELTKPAAFDVPLIRYADNLYWMTLIEAEAAATLNALKLSFGSTSAGELTLHKIRICHADEGFICLGYKVITDPMADSFVPRAYPAGRSFDRHWDRVRAALPAAKPHLRHDLALQMTEEWRRAWTCWNPSTQMIDHVAWQALQIASDLNKLEVATF